MFPVCKAAFLYCSIRLRILFCFILKENAHCALLVFRKCVFLQ